MYALLVFTFLFLLLFPVFLILIYIIRNRKMALYLNLVWARLFFILIFMPIEVVWEFKPSTSTNYILCSNHFSFLDIASIAYTPFSFVFVGKSSLSKIPLFGLMYRSLHITVDREKIRSGYDTFKRSSETLLNGFSLAIFPEGGITSKDPPNMSRFKDGAFRTAVETNTPIVPVTLPYNWKILPDDKSFRMMPAKCKVIYHEPIETKDLGMADISALKQEVFSIIQSTLNRHNN